MGYLKWDQRDLYFRYAQSLRRRTTQYRSNLLPPRHYSEPWTELENNIRDLKNRDSGNAPSIKPKNMLIIANTIHKGLTVTIKSK